MSRALCSYRRWSRALLVTLSLIVQASLLPAQTKAVDKGSVEAVRTFPEPEPQADEAAIREHTKLLRAVIAIDSKTVARFYEEPTSDTVYNSSISVEQGGVSIATYNVGDLIKHQPLRLVHAALIQSGDTGMLICEYEGGAVGAREGFAILRFSPAGVELHTLPLTNFGKVVAFRARPDKAEVWSALPDDARSDADPMAYTTQTCRWQTGGYKCSPPKRKAGRLAPGAIDDPGIEIR